MTGQFFEKPTPSSRVKQTIVVKYFDAWKNVLKGFAKRLIYLDLFSGPGIYEDESYSTPLLILEKAIADKIVTNKLIVQFNDANRNFAKALEKNILKVPGIGTLKYKPKVLDKKVELNFHLRRMNLSSYPTLLFIDPWGYKGVTLDLINSVLKDWGCDCIFFFNYKRINPGLNNKKFDSHMGALFGDVKARELRERIEGKNSIERENIIIEGMLESLKSIGGKFTLPFCFKDKNGVRTSHHLIFVSKNDKGYEIMKEIMAGLSSDSNQGVATFCYNPFEDQFVKMCDYCRPLDDLEGQLLKEFAGQSRYAVDIYKAHNIGTPYIKRNYKEVLSNMEQKGLIKVINPTGKARRKDTFSDKLIVTFPKK